MLGHVNSAMTPFIILTSLLGSASLLFFGLLMAALR
jgi:hypothetical protein